MATNPQAPFPPQSGPPGGPPAPSGVYGQAAAPRPPGGNAPVPPAAPARSRNGLLVVTLIIAVLALVVGLAGVAISAVALGRSDNAVTLANRANDGPLPTPTTDPPQQADPTTAPTTDAPAEPGATTSPGDISPTAEFVVKYQSQRLRVPSENCNTAYTTGIDLDEPRVLDGPDGDITYGGCNPGLIGTKLKLAEIPGQDATPADCLENIRTAPARSPVAPAKGLSLCFLTSQNDAVAQGITQKLVFVTIDALTKSGEHGVLNITLKAWNVPE